MGSSVADSLTPGQLETKLISGLEDVETLLAQETTTARNLSTELVSHLRAAGGKRMRPLLTMLVSQLNPDIRAQAQVPLAVKRAGVAVELTHLASLYHDDLMDAAPVRRGVPAAHVQWNNTLAVMAGDLIFSRASAIMAELGSSYVSYHARTFERLCLGQMDDIFGAPQDGSVSPIDFYLHVLREKTGSLIGAAAYYGASLANCSPELVTALTNFGEDLGVAFQIADDVLDLRSTTAKSGKTPGADLRDGTKTLPVLLLADFVASPHATPHDRDLYREITDLDALQDDAVLALATQKLGAHPVTEQTRELAVAWVERALEHLDAMEENPVKAALRDFAHLQVNRLN